MVTETVIYLSPGQVHRSPGIQKDTPPTDIKQDEKAQEIILKSPGYVMIELVYELMIYIGFESCLREVTEI